MVKAQVRVVCAHDCPDMCSLIAHVEDGRVVKIEGDPDQPFTAGFACAKVTRDVELVHSPERLATRLGCVEETIEADATFETMPSVLFDAVVIPDGDRAANQLASLGHVREFLKDHFRHGKAILML